MSTAPFTRIINPCKTLVSSQMDTSAQTIWVPVNVFAKIEFAIKDNKGRLSITGVEGPMLNGDCRGACGQIIMGMKENPDHVASLTEGWTPEMFARFIDVWDVWHLNDMNAGTPAQRRCLAEAKVDGVRPPDYYKWACDTLKAADLYIDNGYRYGTAWLYEDVPNEVLDFLAGLPESTIEPAWV